MAEKISDIEDEKIINNVWRVCESVSDMGR